MANAYLVKLNTREDDDIWIDENIAVALTKEKAIEAINEDFKNRQWVDLRESDGRYYLYSEITHFDKWYSIEEISLVN